MLKWPAPPAHVSAEKVGKLLGQDEICKVGLEFETFRAVRVPISDYVRLCRSFKIAFGQFLQVLRTLTCLGCANS